jgi:hypothetical protein
LGKYPDEKDNIFAGRPRAGVTTPTATTVSDMLEGFYADKERAFDTGDISERTLGDYKGICVVVGDTLGDDTSVDQLTYEESPKLRRRLGKGKCGKHFSPVRKNDSSTDCSRRKGGKMHTC